MNRNFGSSAAHETDPLPLLPSGPGGVRGESLHRARSSTHRQGIRIIACKRESSIPLCAAKGARRGAKELAENCPDHFLLASIGRHLTQSWIPDASGGGFAPFADVAFWNDSA